MRPETPRKLLAPVLMNTPAGKPPPESNPKFELRDGVRGLASPQVLIHHVVLVAGDKIAGRGRGFEGRATGFGRSASSSCFPETA
jgi:hypothetical protein